MAAQMESPTPAASLGLQNIMANCNNVIKEHTNLLEHDINECYQQCQEAISRRVKYHFDFVRDVVHNELIQNELSNQSQPKQRKMQKRATQREFFISTWINDEEFRNLYMPSAAITEDPKLLKYHKNSHEWNTKVVPMVWKACSKEEKKHIKIAYDHWLLTQNTQKSEPLEESEDTD